MLLHFVRQKWMSERKVDDSLNLNHIIFLDQIDQYVIQFFIYKVEMFYVANMLGSS